MIIVHWHMYPVCATRINSLADFGYKVKVYSERPEVPFKPFTEEEFTPIYLSKKDDPFKIIKEKPEEIQALILTGWAHSKWLKYAKYLKTKGTKIIMMVDNNLRYSIKQLLGKYYFKFFLKNIADYYLVPGNSSRELLKFYGINSGNIFNGYYGFTKNYFPYPFSDNNRAKSFVFVGQKIKRKGIDLLIKAYKKYLKKGGNWDLKIIGHGKFKIEDHPKIYQYEFKQPKELSNIFQRNFVFILPSRLEHWGTVVAEAAASGMILLLSEKVGSLVDLLKIGLNGFSFNPYSSGELSEVLLKIDSLDLSELKKMSEYSVNIAKPYSEESFSHSINMIIKFF